MINSSSVYLEDQRNLKIYDKNIFKKTKKNRVFEICRRKEIRLNRFCNIKNISRLSFRYFFIFVNACILYLLSYFTFGELSEKYHFYNVNILIFIKNSILQVSQTCSNRFEYAEHTTIF